MGDLPLVEVRGSVYLSVAKCNIYGTICNTMTKKQIILHAAFWIALAGIFILGIAWCSFHGYPWIPMLTCVIGFLACPFGMYLDLKRGGAL